MKLIKNITNDDINIQTGPWLSGLLVNAVMNGPSCVLLADTEGNIEYVNRKFSALTGYSFNEAVGRSVSILSPGTGDDNVNLVIWRHLLKGENWFGEIEGCTKSGEHYWEQTSIAPIRDEQRNVIYYLKISYDITERKELENQLMATIATLRMHETQLLKTCRELENTTEELEDSRQKLEMLSHEDALTGLLNRRGLNKELMRLKSLTEREGDAIGFLIIDLDHFKNINDDYGHAAGDYVLKECAQLLSSLMRTSDIICRYGGDEIIIALATDNADTTRLTAQRVLGAVRNHDFTFESKKVPVSISIGAACETPIPGVSLENLMRMADHALYYAKRSGRNAMALWSPDNKPILETDDLHSRGFSIHSEHFRHVFNTVAAMLQAREKATGDHSRRVTRMAVILAQALRLPPPQIELCEQGALLHDIGKIAIPDTILLKPGPLTDEEREIIKQHPKTGYDILKSDPEFKDIAEIVLSHQERFDGTGYPRGLKGMDICIGARIFAVVDSYDAMRAGRVYSASKTPEEALEEIERCSGTHFDPQVVEAFRHCQNRLERVLTAID